MNAINKKSAVKTEEKAVKTEEKAVKTEEKAYKDVSTKPVKTEEKVVKTEEKAVKTEEKAVKTEEKAVKTEEKAAKTEEKAVKTEEKAVKTEETIEKSVVAVNIGEINVSNDCKIECAVNPKRTGSKAHSRYAAYENASTIGEYLECGGLRADLRYDLLHGFLVVKEVIINGAKVQNPKLADK